MYICTCMCKFMHEHQDPWPLLISSSLNKPYSSLHNVSWNDLPPEILSLRIIICLRLLYRSPVGVSKVWPYQLSPSLFLQGPISNTFLTAIKNLTLLSLHKLTPFFRFPKFFFSKYWIQLQMKLVHSSQQIIQIDFFRHLGPAWFSLHQEILLRLSRMENVKSERRERIEWWR